MSLTIWKFPLPIGDDVRVRMPRHARVLSVAAVRDEVFLWAIIDPAEPEVSRPFSVRGTGHELGEVGEYVGTVVLLGGALVFHVFDDCPRP